MSARTLDFLRDTFFEYYAKCFEEKCIPSSFERREFGALLFKGKIMVRHKSFTSASEVRGFLCSLIPSDVYYSSSYYELPSASEMSAKGWMGADLTFDIDADHIPVHCDKTHDLWTCNSCGSTGNGAPERCPKCGGEKLDRNSWPCEICLASAKVEATKLLDFLLRDFGFSEEDVRVFFSGHRGYHVQVESEAVRMLDSVARREIVDYIFGLGLDLGVYGLGEMSDRRGRALSAPKLADSGWRGRLAVCIDNLLCSATDEDYRKIELKETMIRRIMNNREEILRRWNDTGLQAVKDLDDVESWRKIFSSCISSASAKVDTVVTADVHRLIRMAGTLHGKTGLKKVEFPISHIEDFDPFKSATAFKNGSTHVIVSDAPKFRLGDEVFGPYKNTKVELPTAAAVLLICKNRAEVLA